MSEMKNMGSWVVPVAIINAGWCSSLPDMALQTYGRGRTRRHNTAPVGIIALLSV
jgi:hypothetical protein